MKWANSLGWLSAALLSLASLAVHAGDVDKETEERIRGAISVPGSGVEIADVNSTPIDGVYEVKLVNGPVVYTLEDASYFVVGDLYAVNPGGFVNISELRRNDQRKQQLAGIDRDNMIVFAAEGETRGAVTVFTDITCGYCQKLHQEVPELNRRGIEVRYMAYPRTGLDTPGYRMLVTAWCAKDPNDTLTRMKNREQVSEAQCDDNPVTEHFIIGQQLGVRGTPALFLDNGQMIAGYRTADQLEIDLGLASQNQQ